MRDRRPPILLVARRVRHLALLALLLVGACSTPDAGALDARRPAITMGAPEDVGLSPTALAETGPTMQAAIDEGRTGGIVTLVARDGVVVHWEAHGWRVLGEDPLERDDVFRIYSMTKPVTSVAAMMLVEEGRLELDQPLEDVLPAFAGVQVYDDGALRPPARSITIQDLLRHTSGITYGIFGNSPVDRMYVDALQALEMDTGRTLEETVDIVAGLPLLADPGTLWNYSMSTDVLGRVVEVASGMSLDAFFRTRIFEPLGMDDTGFHVAEESHHRLLDVYTRREGGLLAVDAADGSPFTEPPSWYSGGGGLTSTPSDYLRFAQMLANEGALGGVRLLRPETVQAMTTNQLDEALLPMRLGGPIPSHGWGLGFAVGMEGPVEDIYWWAGIANTRFWIDPVEDIVAFAWTQYLPSGGVSLDGELRRIVYESLVERRRTEG